MYNSKGCIAFLYSFLLLAGRVCFAQERDFTFNRVIFPNENFGWTRGIAQDRQGFMWFATEVGLYRYDGYDQIHYTNDPSNSNTLASRNLECILIDKDGFIWVGTTTLGLDRLDPVTGNVEHFQHQEKKENSLINNSVRTILQDTDGTFWIGTLGGLDHFDYKSGSFKHYQHSINDSTSISNNMVRMLYKDKQNVLWVGTGEPYLYAPLQPYGEGGLNRFDPKNGKFTRYMHDSKNPHSLIDNRVTAIFEDKRGTFWIGTAGDGLHSMDRNKGTFKRHLYDSIHPEKLSRPALNDALPYRYDHITFITEDTTGVIWIGTIDGGINCYNPATEDLKHYLISNSFGKDNSLLFKDRNAYTIFVSREGIVWIGTIEHLYRVDPFFEKIPFTVCKKQVTCLFQDSDSVRWIGTTTGLIRENLKTGQQKEYLHDSSKSGSISNNIINCIRRSKDGKLWIGTALCLDKFDEQRQVFTHYLFDPQKQFFFDQNNVNSIYEENNNIWVGTGGQGIYLMDIKTGKFILYQHNLKDSNSLSQNVIIWLYKDKQQRFWAGMWNNGGVDRFDAATGKFKHYLKNKNSSCAFQDKNGVLWVGTSDGLYYLNSAIDSFIRFTDPNAQVKISYVLSIFDDAYKNLWISTKRMIIRLNPGKNNMNVFDWSFGVKYNGYIYIDHTKGFNGQMFLPDDVGYYSFIPEQVITNPFPPEIVIADFRIKEEATKNDSAKSLTFPSFSTEISLKYDENFFSIGIAIIHYSDPENNKCFYMLENLDDTWRVLGGDRRAYYFNVPPGKYILRIKAANLYNVWAEKKITIIITPPWWKTWWAFTLFIIALIVLVYSIYRNRINSLNLKQQEQIHAMVATQEEERKRISRDLHDDVGTKLSTLKLFLSSLNEKAKNTNNEEIRSLTESSEQFITEAMQDVRQLLLNLSPTVLEEFGYTTAVEGLVNKINGTKQIHFDLVIFGIENRLQKDYELALYRITQELINNVLKHAEAKQVSLQIGRRDEKIILMMEDDGKGFDVHAHKTGYGLQNLNARTKLMHGTMTIDSHPGKGTSVLIEIPYNFNGI